MYVIFLFKSNKDNGYKWSLYFMEIVYNIHHKVYYFRILTTKYIVLI